MNAKLKQRSLLALLIAYVLISILLLLPNEHVNHDTGFTASELEVRETVEGKVTRTSYVNSDGLITNAIDMGYATVERTRNSDGQIAEEFYYDAAGNPAKRHHDYWGIAYIYLNDSIVIRYRTADKQPMVLSSGYSAIVRTQVDGQATDDFYCDLNMRPVQCTGGYFGLHREYDEQGRNCSVTYFNENEKPVICMCHRGCRFRAMRCRWFSGRVSLKLRRCRWGFSA